jgi:hypothetical protein
MLGFGEYRYKSKIWGERRIVSSMQSVNGERRSKAGSAIIRSSACFDRPCPRGFLENRVLFGYHTVVSDEGAGTCAPPSKGDKPSNLAAWLTFVAAIFGGIVTIVVAIINRPSSEKPVIAAPPAAITTPIPTASLPKEKTTQTPASTNVPAEFYWQEGLNAYRDKNYDAAITNYSEAIRLKPNVPELYYNRGIAYYALNQYDRAITDYTDSIRLNPYYGAAYYYRGSGYYALNQYDRAITDYTEAIRLNPYYGAAYYYRGNAYDRLGNSLNAQQDREKATALAFKP